MGRRRGRRDNGLDAADYAAVGDLDPRVGEHLLDLLGARGIAAYLQPSMDVNPITRNTTVPDRPVDRLFADRAHLRIARDYLRQLTNDDSPAAPWSPDAAGSGSTGPVDSGTDSGGPATGATADADRPASDPRAGDPDPDAPQPLTGREEHESSTTWPGPTPSAASPAQWDATFAGIVAGFDRPVDPTSATWPTSENLGEAEQASSTATPPGPLDARHLTEASLMRGLESPSAEPYEPEPVGDVEPGEGRFVPPPPPPLPRLSRQAVLGGLAVLLGLAMVLAPGAGPLDRGESMLLGFAAIFGGAVALILRLRPGTDPDDHPDDGAQV